jgi:uncharacterized 2Fe-2S/4Fe-4S cluster protein (DUF4445 family)
MIEIKVISGDETRIINADEGASLLGILRRNGYEPYAPCGGKGTCGKCITEVSGEGNVVSCTFFPGRDIEVILPDRTEAEILTDQTEYLYDLPLEPENTIYNSPQPYGVAVDVGTTTVVMYFLDLVSGKIGKIASFINPQGAYGSDVISRINYCQLHDKGLQELQQAIISALNRELKIFAAGNGINTDCFERLVFTGNTTMLHLLLGEDPVSIALAPFTPRFTERQTKGGGESGLAVNNEAVIVTMPSISAFVGADIVAGLAALNVKQEKYLFTDIGTNGEIALVTGDEIYTCAAAAGPAFEGAGISCGMSALKGAISSFAGPGSFRVIGNTKPAGICGSGIVDIVSWLLHHGIVNETGYMQDEFPVYAAGNIYMTRKDIREIQLAKSAIYSGMKILLERRGLAFKDMDALFLAGGFGNYINVESALRIGLLPGDLAGRIYPVGNSAGIGALQYLKSTEFAVRAETIAKRTSYLELSHDTDFTTQFAMNLGFEGRADNQ